MSRFIPSSLIQPKAQKQYSKKAKTVCAIKQKAFNLFCSTKSTDIVLLTKKQANYVKKLSTVKRLNPTQSKPKKYPFA